MSVNNFLIVVPFRNAKSWIGMCIHSIISQNYPHFRVLIIDDASQDGSEHMVENSIKNDSRFTYIRNDIRRGAVYNKTIALEKLNPADEEIVLGIDGDDYLLHQDALSILNKEWTPDVWISYGNFICNKNVPDYGKPLDFETSIRAQPFRCAAPRAVRWFLLKSLRIEDLTDSETNVLFTLPEDWIIMLPLLEVAGKEHIKFIRNRIYFYRITEHYEMHTSIDAGNRVRRQLTGRMPRNRLDKTELFGRPPAWY